jgi:DNA invertase Pin-like site-specific DNA recombinase
MMGVFAEFERGMIQEYVKSGLARAKKHGTKSGKAIVRPATSPETEASTRELRAQGMDMLKIAKQLPCGVSVSRCLGGSAGRDGGVRAMGWKAI